MHPTLYSEAALDAFIKAIKASYGDPLGNTGGRFRIRRAKEPSPPPPSPEKPTGASKTRQRSKSKSKSTSVATPQVDASTRSKKAPKLAQAAQTSTSASKASAQLPKKGKGTGAIGQQPLVPTQTKKPKPRPTVRSKAPDEAEAGEVEPRLVGTRSGAVFDLAVKKGGMDEPMDMGESDGGTIASDDRPRNRRKSQATVAVSPEIEDFTTEINSVQSSKGEGAENLPASAQQPPANLIGKASVETWNLIHPKRMPAGRKANSEARMPPEKVSTLASKILDPSLTRRDLGFAVQGPCRAFGHQSLRTNAEGGSQS